MLEQNNIWKYFHYVLIGLAGILVIQLGYFFLLKSFYPQLTLMGEFGESFGAFNALVSASAFAVLIITILMQKSQLELQKKELLETIKVLKSQHEQLELQSKILSKERFETTFFNLLNYLNISIDDIPQVWDWDVPADQRRYAKGRESFLIVYDSLKKRKEQNNLSTYQIIDEFHKCLAFKFLNFFEVLFNILIY